MTEDQFEFAERGFLIVDDKAFLRSIVHNMLVPFKPKTIKQASNGVDAIEILENDLDKIHCVLCDWSMQPMDGLAFLRLIRMGISNPGIPRDLPIIMISGYADEPLVNTCIALDANGYMVKPLSSGNLIKNITKAFANKIKLNTSSEYEAIETIDDISEYNNSRG